MDAGNPQFYYRHNFYTVEAPVEAPDGYELKKVVVNGTEMSKSDFDKAYLKEGKYQLDVKKGPAAAMLCSRMFVL